MPGGLNVIGIETDQGHVPVQPAAPVIIALGTIESALLALLSLQGEPNSHLVGRNLIAHLRSNLTIRIPREALATLDPNVKALQASALFVKGRHRHGDGTTGHFHLQITASGLGALGTDSEADLFKKVPDIDGFAAFQAATANHVVITIRGIGEMESLNPNNLVTESDARRRRFGAPAGGPAGTSPDAFPARRWLRGAVRWLYHRKLAHVHDPGSAREGRPREVHHRGRRAGIRPRLGHRAILVHHTHTAGLHPPVGVAPLAGWGQLRRVSPLSGSRKTGLQQYRVCRCEFWF